MLLTQHRSGFVGTGIEEAVTGETNDQTLVAALEEAKHEEKEGIYGAGNDSEDEEGHGCLWTSFDIPFTYTALG